MERITIYRHRHVIHRRKTKRMEADKETQNFLIKLAVYTLGVTLGLAAKLSIINQQKKLTLGVAIMHALMAFSAAWITWFVMSHYNAEDWLKNGSAIIVGRYGDYILIAAWKAFRQMINTKDKII